MVSSGWSVLFCKAYHVLNFIFRLPYLWKAGWKGFRLARENCSVWVYNHAEFWRWREKLQIWLPFSLIKSHFHLVTVAVLKIMLQSLLCFNDWSVWTLYLSDRQMWLNYLCPAMSSYLFIVKYELPEVIRAFLGLEESSGWVMATYCNS